MDKRMTFWHGFYKRAADAGMGDGGGGFFAGIGKGQNPVGQLQPAGAEGKVDTGDTMASRELFDLEKNPRSFDIHSMGPELEDENGSHVRY